ncbi:putative Group 2 [Cinnamomum micranthum f. kanehirae]|uniref:Putative Group 2 n=1 Tax=Cinnamomum micranthum f. kanehirae TaxID=337451 RepID=A0A3S3Q1Y8_9MAGN|nr:putative Group 2 [Cinnamomum micranthum f. kanehirae]
MANQRIDEDQEALFHSYPCADYYVQSPSSVSHANSTDCRNHDSTFLSSYPLESFNTNPSNPCQEVSRLTLSRYSSSRGSNNSFLHEKKISYDLNSHGNGTGSLGIHPICGIEEAEEEDCEDDFKRRPGLLSFGYSSSWVCVSFQILWRLVVSFGISLLVFFLVTRPPPPKISVKMAGVRQFELGEGVDNSGVVTKILTCNCSLHLEIENQSKLFGLHIRPPTMDMAFGRVNFASSHGERLYIESGTWLTYPVYVGTKNRAMYGAGRTMQDMLESGKGLPILIHLSLSSNIRVVWNLIRPTYHHHATCLLVLLNGDYDKRHNTDTYNSTCTTTAYT